MSSEKSPNSAQPRPPLLEESVDFDKAAIYAAIASDLGIPFRVIPRSGITDPFKMPRDGELRILVNYGERYGEFFDRVHEFFPSPPPRPMPASDYHKQNPRTEPIDPFA